MNEVLREFLLETHENLAQIDLDLVTLEKDPQERETLARAFRTLHTVKGTAGFLGLDKLQAIAHAAEHLLGKLRAGELPFNPPIASALLTVVDAVRQILASLEAQGSEGDFNPAALIATLEDLQTEAADDRRTSVSARPTLPTPALPTPALPTPALPTPALPTPALPPRAEPSAVPAERPAAGVTLAGGEALQEVTEARASAVSDTAIRVDVGLLDKLMTLVGELVLARNQIMQFSASQEDTPFLGTVQRLNLLTTELQAHVMKTRMQPIQNLWSKFPRVVRDLAIACDKQVRLDMEGQDTELDKTILEAIRDPLTHLVRNAVDHGIELPAERLRRGKPEQGRLKLHAFHEGGKVILEIADDGAGIDPARVRNKAIAQKLISAEQAARLGDAEAVNLIFLPGFSTAEKITHFSGRGVGMDVVRTHVEKIGGTVSVESRLHAGTTIRLKIPLTLAIIPALTVASGGDRYAIAQVNLLELVRLERDQASRGIERIHGAAVYRLRGNLLPLVYLNRELRLPEAAEPQDLNIVVLQADERQFGLVVDAIHDTEEIVVKPLQKQLKGIPVFAGATIMGDGKVALILDVLGLAQHANVIAARERVRDEERQAAAPRAPRAASQAVLLFATRDGGRMAVPLAEVARLEEFSRSQLERAGARSVVQYRGEILPLLDVARLLRPRNGHRPRSSRRAPAAEASLSPTVSVVVHARHGRRVGLVVSQILDIVEEDVTARARASRPGVQFTAVIQERVTEFLDVEGLLRLADCELLDAVPAVPAEQNQPVAG